MKTGVNEETAIESLAKLKGVSGRMELAGYTKDRSPIFIDFAHTEDGLDKLFSGQPLSEVIEQTLSSESLC